MIRKITLENFMSHGNTVIELADGLTVLTGPNNCGKSALVAALQILASNSKSTHVIRHGAKFSRITVETDDGHTVVWHRKKTTVKYNLNGVDVHRVGQGVPEELPTTLRLDRVTTESGASKNDYDIHFGEQKSPVFLLNETGSRAAAFFASSSDAARLVEMQHKHRTRTAARRSDAKRLTDESALNVARLAALAPIDAISESVKVAETLQAEIESAQQQLRTLIAIINRLNAVAAQVARWRSQQNVLRELDRTDTTPEQLQQTRDRCLRIRTWLRSATAITQSRQFEQQRSAALATLLPVPAQHPAKTLATRITKIDQTRQRLAAATAVTDACDALTGPAALLPADPCRRAIAKLRTATQVHRSAKRIVNAVSPLSPPPLARETRGITRMIQQFQQSIGMHARWTARQAITQPLLAPPAIASAEKLRKTIDMLSTARGQQTRLARHRETFDRLRPIEPHTDPKPIGTLLSRLTPAITTTQHAREKAARAQTRMIQCEQSIRDFVLENPNCATCGGSINPETLMSMMPGLHEHAAELPAAAPEKKP